MAIAFQGLFKPWRSVETPVAKRPLDATAREPPRSTARNRKLQSEARVTEHLAYPYWLRCPHEGCRADSTRLVSSCKIAQVEETNVYDLGMERFISAMPIGIGMCSSTKEMKCLY